MVLFVGPGAGEHFDDLVENIVQDVFCGLAVTTLVFQPGGYCLPFLAGFVALLTDVIVPDAGVWTAGVGGYHG